VPFAEGLGELAVSIGIDAAAERYGVALSTSALAFRVHKRKALAVARKARDVEIMRLASRGWNNARIAARVELSASTVGKIVAASIKATRPKGAL